MNCLRFQYAADSFETSLAAVHSRSYRVGVSDAPASIELCRVSKGHPVAPITKCNPPASARARADRNEPLQRPDDRHLGTVSVPGIR